MLHGNLSDNINGLQTKKKHVNIIIFEGDTPYATCGSLGRYYNLQDSQWSVGQVGTHSKPLGQPTGTRVFLLSGIILQWPTIYFRTSIPRYLPSDH